MTTNKQRFHTAVEKQARVPACTLIRGDVIILGDSRSVERPAMLALVTGIEFRLDRVTIVTDQVNIDTKSGSDLVTLVWGHPRRNNADEDYTAPVSALENERRYQAVRAELRSR